MDFHAAMETFAEAWVAANTQTIVNSDSRQVKQASLEDLPTQLPRDQLQATKTTPTKQPPPAPSELSPTSSGSGTRSLPIHCVIEQTNGSPSFDNTKGDRSMHNSVELDSYAILPGSTLLSECVRAALLKLGYNSTEVLGAKGAIQLKNWKPLVFDMITENKGATIDDILGELTQVATLRIRICSDGRSGIPDNWTDQSVRCAVQELLKEMNQSTLAKLSPLSQSAISNIANWKYQNKLSAEKCKEFGSWYKNYKNEQGKKDTFEDGVKDTRLTFHPEHELPLLRQWYKKSKNPNDNKLAFYANTLNSGHVRQEKPKITVVKLRNWWKNERQREKRISAHIEIDTEESEIKAKSAKCEDVKVDNTGKFDVSQNENTCSSTGGEKVVTLLNVDNKKITQVPREGHHSSRSTDIKYGISTANITDGSYQPDSVFPDKSTHVKQSCLTRIHSLLPSSITQTQPENQTISSCATNIQMVPSKEGHVVSSFSVNTTKQSYCMSSADPQIPPGNQPVSHTTNNQVVSSNKGHLSSFSVEHARLNYCMSSTNPQIQLGNQPVSSHATNNQMVSNMEGQVESSFSVKDTKHNCLMSTSDPHF